VTLPLYLSGDRDQTAEQETVVRRHFGAELVVMNTGGIFSTSPDETAWVMNELVQPKSAIALHADEAATESGQVKADSRPGPH